jgi:hypothetical protein
MALCLAQDLILPCFYGKIKAYMQLFEDHPANEAIIAVFSGNRFPSVSGSATRLPADSPTEVPPG